MKQTQEQMFYAAVRRSRELNELFMEMIKDPDQPMTKAELEKLIAKRPHIYGRFAGFLDQLK